MDENAPDIEDSRQERTNVPAEPLRWSTLAAGREFGLYRTTLQKRLVESGTVPGDDGLYSTADILKALHGDLEAEKVRKMRADADHSELRNAVARHELIEAEAVSQLLSDVALAIRTEILGNADLTSHQKDSLLDNLKRLQP